MIIRVVFCMMWMYCIYFLFTIKQHIIALYSTISKLQADCKQTQRWFTWYQYVHNVAKYLILRYCPLIFLLKTTLIWKNKGKQRIRLQRRLYGLFWYLRCHVIVNFFVSFPKYCLIKYELDTNVYNFEKWLFQL